ncbi:phage major capsid protein [Methylobacterium sp. Leaf118]|uniref:phage major capsid protein n=1 Tax=Methylobacterium sp. Leaf118 TaxID=2876562 RepID=UPI001E3DC348|nr:phage major capsid protein [Methylobacterium sp. Leaf118]
MKTHPLRAGAIPAAFHASFLANCGIGGIRVALEKPDGGAAAAAGAMAGAGEAEFKAAAANLKTIGDEVKRLAEGALSEAKNAGKLSDETKAAVDGKLGELVKEMKAFDGRLADAEQKAARRGGPGGGEQIELKTLGQHFADSEGFKAIKENGAGFRGNVRATVETKAMLTVPGVTGSTTSLSNSIIQADRRGIVNLPDRTLRVRDLITPGQTNSNNIEYPVETTYTNAAAMVAEGAKKPESSLAFDMRSAPVRTLAHIFKASRQLLDDAAGLVSYIDGRARYGLRFAEEAQILYGNGTGQNLAGIMPQASAYAAPFAVTGETPIDRLRLAILQATLALYPATGIVLNDTDWAKIEMIKDTQGRYLIGNPQGNIAANLWGLPVATTLAMTANDFLVGAFRAGAQLFDRMAIEVLLSTENVDDFEKNMITIRAEERLGLAVYRPAAFVKGVLVTP